MSKDFFWKGVIVAGIVIICATLFSLYLDQTRSDRLQKQVIENENRITKELRDRIVCSIPSTVSSTLDYVQISYPKHGLTESHLPEGLIVLNETMSRNPAKPISIVQKIEQPLKDFLQAGLEAGHVLLVNSAYRSYSRQEAIFNNPLNDNGTEHSLAARPGYSEHQLGTTVDISASLFSASELQRGYAWMEANAHTFGFIHSYPRGSEDITGFQYEPWHVRYLGVEVATRMKNNEIIYNEMTEPFIRNNQSLYPYRVDPTKIMSGLVSVDGVTPLLSSQQLSFTGKELETIINGTTTNPTEDSTELPYDLTIISKGAAITKAEFSLRNTAYEIYLTENSVLDAYQITIAAVGEAQLIHEYVADNCRYLN